MQLSIMRRLFVTLLTISMCACNGMAQKNISIAVAEFEGKLASGKYQLLDVRTANEYRSGYIRQSVQADWLNKDEFASRTQHLDLSKPVLVYCASGVRSEQAARWLLQKGFKEVWNLKGGTAAWQVAGKSLEAATQTPQMKVRDFEQKITGSSVVLVDVGAEWCPPCKKMEPVLVQLQKELSGQFQLLKVDGGTDIEVMKHIKADALPTFIVYKNGKEVWRNNGVVTLETLKDKILR